MIPENWAESPPPNEGTIFWHQIYPFQAILSNFGFGGRKAHPPPRWGNIFWHQIYPFQAILSNFGFGGRKPPLPQWGKIFWHQIYPFQAISSNFGFGGRKAHPPQMREKFLTPDLSISGNFKQLWFWWQKRPPRWGKIFWHQIYPFQAILSNFGFCGRKDTPKEGNIFDTRSIHFRQFQATLVLVAEKPAPPWDEGKFLTPDLSISGNFEQLWFWWQKRSPRWGKIFWHQIYPFQAISSNFGFGGRKDPPQMRGKFLTPDLSTSGNFKQLWFWWQKNPPPHMRENFLDTRSIHFRQFWATLVLVAEKPTPMRENFWHQIYPFQGILSNFGFGGRKAHPDEGKFFDTRSIHFRQFWATLVLVAENLPSPDEGKIFDTRSIHFRQFWATLVLVAEKPTPMRENFLTPDLSISGNFEQLWFWWQKSPRHPPDEGKIFWHQIYPFQAILSNFGFGGRKAPSPSQMREKILTPDISISGNFKQLWFWWQKRSPRWGKKFWHQIYPFQAILSNFGFGGRKDPPPQMRGKFLTPDLSISGNFKQLWFWWQKNPPTPHEGKFLDTRSIHFRKFWATLVLVAENLPSPDEGKNFDTRSIHFRQFQATLILVAEKPTLMREIFFWHQIYPFQGILSNFGFGGRKAPPPTPQMRGKFFDTRSIHFRQFWATLVLVAEKPPPPPRWGKNFDTRSIHFRQFQATLVLVAEKTTPAN